MALKWFETADIVTQEATTTRRKAESLFDQMRQRQIQRREAEEAEARRRKELSMKQTLEVMDSRRCARAADDINEINKTLRGSGLEPISLTQSNVRAQVNSGFTWADNIAHQAQQANQRAIQEAEQKLRADVVGKLLKDGVLVVGSPADVAEPLIQAAIAQRKAEDALKAGDYEAAAQWQAMLQGAPQVEEPTPEPPSISPMQVEEPTVATQRTPEMEIPGLDIKTISAPRLQQIFPQVPTVAGKTTPLDTVAFPEAVGYGELATTELAPARVVAETLGKSFQQLPQQVAASVLQAAQGQGGASVVNRDWADRFIAEANEDLDKFVEDIVKQYPDSSLLLELAQVSRNLGYSVTSMGAGLAVGVPMAFIPVPGARYLAWSAGTAASGAVAYQMTTYQIMQEYLEAKNDEKMAQIGTGLTLEEENQLKADFHSKAHRYGLWEAVPEAISNLLFAQILAGPLGKMVTGPIATRIITKMAMIYGEEFLTETITQKGQSAIEVEAGLREERIGWVEAFKEIAPQTFLLTTIMAGAGQVIVGSVQSIKKITNSLKTKIGETHPLYEEIKKGIETTPEDIVSTEPAPEVTEPVTPAVAEEVTPAATKATLIESKLEEGLFTINIEGESVGAVKVFPQKDALFANRISIHKEGVLTRSLLMQLDTLLTDMARTQGKKNLRLAVRPENLSLYKRAGYTQEGDSTTMTKEVTPEVAPEVAAPQPVVEPTALAEWETITAPIEGVEVTVEGLEPIKNIRAIQSRYIAQRDVEAIKAELVKYTKAHLPKEVQGKMLASVKNVKTEAQLRKAINKANEYAEVAVQKSLIPQIKNELLKITPRKIVTGAKYGKFTPETQKILDGIKKNINRERTDVQEEILKYMEAAEKGTIDYAEANEQIEILSHSGLKGMSSDEMASTLSYIKTLKETGRGIRTAERERDVAILKETTDAVGDALTGGKGIKPGAETVGTQGFEKKTGKWERVENVNLGLDDVLDKLSKFDMKSLPMQSPLSQIGDNLHLSRSFQITGNNQWLDKAIVKLGELFDAKSRNELNTVLNELSTDKIELGVFKNTDGVEVTLSLTRDQLTERWMQLQDPTLERTFREGMKWTDEMMAAVEDKIYESDSKMAQWLMNNYQTYGNELQSYYREKFHMDLPGNPYFSPLSRDVQSDTHEHLAFASQTFAYSSVTSKHLIPRVKSIAPLKNNGALNTYVKFIGEMEHFKAFSSSMKLARQVFGNKDVKTAIRQYHGENILKHLNNHLDDIARDGIDKRKIVSQLDTIRRNFTIAVLARPSVSAKQFLSLPAYMMHNRMPIADFFSGVADFWKNPIQNYRMMGEKSSYLSERWTRGHERDIRLVKAKGWQQRLSNKKNWRDYFMVGIQFFDTLATAQGSYAVYKSMIKQKLGEQRAVLEAELATKRTQPSFGLEDMAALRKGGSFWALATMFMSQPNKYFRVISNNARNLQYGRGDKKRALFHVIMAWAVLPMIFQWVSDAFQWKEKRQLRAGLLGPLNLMFIARDISQGLWGWASQDQEFQYQGSPVFSTINEMQWALGGTVRLIEQGKDPLKEIDSEYFIKIVEHYAQVAGRLGGLPTPYLVQLERAIRNADLRQIIFTEYSLRGAPEQEAEKKALRKIQDAYAVAYGKTKWTELTKTEQSQFWQLRPDLE